MSPRPLALLTLVLVSLALPARPVPAQPQKPADPADVYGDPLPEGALARLGTVRWRHGGPVFFVGLSGGGKHLVTVSQDGWLRVLDAATGRELRRFGNPAWGQRNPGNPAEESVYYAGAPGAVALSADGRILATGAHVHWRDDSVRVWDVAAGKELWSFRWEGRDSGLALSPDGKTLVAQGRDGVRQWDVATGKERDNFPPPEDSGMDRAGAAHQFVFSPDGKVLAGVVVADSLAALRNRVKLWDVAGGKLLHQIKGPRGDYSCLAFSPDGKRLALPQPVENAIGLWDVATGKEVGRLKAPDLGRQYALAFSPDGKVLASRGVNRFVRLWDVAAGKELRHVAGLFDPSGAGTVVNGHPGGLAQGLRFSADGQTLFSVSDSYRVRRWDVASGKELLDGGHTGAVWALAFSPDGKVVTTEADAVRQWDARTGKEVRQVNLPKGAGLVTLAPNGRTLAFDHGLAVRLWDLTTHRELRRWNLPVPDEFVDAIPPGMLIRLRFSDNGRFVSGTSYDGTLRVWDTTDGKEMGALRPHPGQLDEMYFGTGSTSFPAISPDGKLLVQLETKSRLVSRTIGEGGPPPDRSAMTSVVRIYEVPRGKELHRFELTGAIDNCAFSPDGRNLITAGADGTLSVWEVATGQLRCRLKGGGPSVVVAPDGRTLASGAGSTLRFWDLVNGQVLGEFPGHLSRITAVAFAPDGRTAATGSTDTTALVWTVPERPKAKPPAPPLTPKQAEALCAALKGKNGETAFRAVQVLAAAPGPEAVAALRKRLPPVPEVPAQRLKELIDDLGSPKFAVRQKAAGELEALGELAEPAMRERLTAGKVPLEVRRRLELLLSRERTVTPDWLFQLRAVEALEWIGTAEARKALEALAAGARGARQTQEAQAALRRLGK
jgi:WD40 repeat protein